MKKRGLTFAFIGLLCGVLIGLGIVTAERYLAGEIKGLLSEMVERSCPCQFAADSIDVSLLRLRATARNARIEVDGKPELAFRRLNASFGLTKIFDKVINLSELRLFDGQAQGVSPRSATYKFIDFLTQPIAPELDRPDRWKLKLQTIRLRNSKLFEKIGSTTLIGSGVELDLTRTASDDFIMTPSIDRLELEVPVYEGRTAKGTRKISLGKLSTVVHFQENAIALNKLLLAHNDSTAKAEALIDQLQNDALTGPISYNLLSDSYNLSSDIKAQFSGSGTLGQTIDNPSFQSIFNSVGITQPHFLDPFIPLPALTQLSGKASFSYNQGDPFFRIDDASAESDNASLTQSSPIIVNDREIKGALKLKVGSLWIGDPEVKANDISLDLVLGGDLVGQTYKVSGEAANLDVAGLIIPRLEFDALKLPDELTLRVEQPSSSLKLDGRVIFPIGTSAKADKLNLSFKDLALLSGGILDSAPADSGAPRLTGEGTLSGPLTFEGMEGQFKLVMSARHLEGQGALRGSGTLSHGVFTSKLQNINSSIQSDVKLQIAGKPNTEVTLVLNNFKPGEYDSTLECLAMSGRADLNGPGFSIANLSGKISLDHFQFGCKPYEVSLNSSATFPLVSGTLTVPKSVSFSGPESLITLSGSISPSDADLLADGKIELSSLLPYLPSFDDIRGQARVKITLSGPRGARRLSGKAELNDGDFAIASVNVSAESIEARLELNDQSIEVKKLSGVINRGQFSMKGYVYPLELARSNLEIQARRVELQPFTNTFLVASADLLLSGKAVDQGPGATLSGDITVESGEIRKKLDLQAVVTSLTTALFSRDRDKKIVPTPAGAKLRAVELDIQVKAARNVFLLTSFAAAEMGGWVQVAGTLAEPRALGELSLLSGWFGLKERRFNISNGAILIRSDLEEPILDLVAESTIRTPQGDSTLIMLSAKGPLSSPTIELTSDQGLSQREIVSLITSLGTFAGEYTEGSLKLNEYGPSSSFNIGRTIKQTIESLSVEPSYNPFTGAIEPKIVARAPLSNRLALIGRSNFSANTAEQQAYAEYTLSPKLKLTVGIENRSQEEQSAYMADLTLTLLGKQREFLNISVEGNDEMDRIQLLESLRINANSRIAPDQIGKLSSDLRRNYRRIGFFNPRINLSCEDDGTYCRALSIKVEEGQISKIDRVEFSGDNITEILGGALRVKAKVGDAATSQLRDDTANSLTRQLRSEGYIAAKVRAKFERTSERNRVALKISIDAGKPISFIFSGNKQFNVRELLDTIQLFERTIPFGQNTVNILVENIERLYRERGFLYATISYTRDTTSSDRTLYRINIDEGAAVLVHKVSFKGLTQITSEKLIELIRASDDLDSEGLLYPTAAVAEQLSYFAKRIEQLLIAQGYDDAQVEYELSDNGAELEIIYKISEGQNYAFSNIEITGWPEDMPLPLEPEAPLSVTKVNKFSETLVKNLRANSYLLPIVTTELGNDRSLSITIEPGTQTRISAVEISGNQEVSNSTIESKFKINSGDLWSSDQIDQMKRRLLRLGLFSRIEVTPKDGTLDGPEETLVLRVEEKALRTLEIGGGINTESGVHIFGDATDRKFFADGRLIGARVDLYYDPRETKVERGVAGLRYADPDFILEDVRLTEDLRFQRLTNSNLPFDLDRTSLASALSHSWESGWQYTFGHSLLFDQTDSVEPDVVLSDLDRGNVRLSFLSQIIALDRRDNILNPRRGYRFALENKIASQIIGSQADFLEATGTFSFLHPFSALPRISIANSSRLGASWPWDGTEEMPISQRYFIGGQNSVRGFRENSLGPQGDQSNVTGGDLVVLNNLELRYLLADSLSIHTFLDAGTVYLKSQSNDISDIRRSIGIGFRYLSPIGPVGFDLGHPLDEKEGEPSVRLHFNIGSNF